MNMGMPQTQESCLSGGIQRRSTLDVLKDKKKDATDRIAKIDEYILLFENNPDLARALDFLGSI